MSMSPASLGGRRSPSAIVFAAFLIKLAKHFALLACLAIVGQATGGAALPQPAVLGLVVCAALLHALGQTLKRRSHNRQTTLRGPT
jgi:hypothetical protein